ncbi:MAG: hypothetical protein ACLPVY_26750 [Acidimicrobiia bacterium]
MTPAAPNTLTAIEDYAAAGLAPQDGSDGFFGRNAAYLLREPSPN